MTSNAPELTNALDALSGVKVPGGCTRCNSIQELSANTDGVYVLTVTHEATCTALS